MYPKKCNEIYKKIADKYECDESLVSDLIHFVFKELRDNMSNLRDVTYNIPYIGRFEATMNLIKKEIKRKEKEYDGCFYIDNIHEVIGPLERAYEKAEEMYNSYNKNKLEKLKWHKENGDPYKKYNKEQEENIKRRIEYTEKKTKRRKNCKKENGDLQ